MFFLCVVLCCCGRYSTNTLNRLQPDSNRTRNTVVHGEGPVKFES